MKTNRVLLLFATLAFTTSNAFALTTLKQVQVSNGSQIDLLFDGKVTKGQIKTEFFNDVIQISLSDVSVYPAKISSVSGGNLTKIFAYQYAPKLVRCRLSVKGRAESYKDRLFVSSGGPNGRMLTIRLSAPQAAQIHQTQLKGEDAEEQALLEKVLKSPPRQAVPAAASVPAVLQAKDSANSDRIVEKTAAPVRADSKSFDDSENKPLNFDHDGSRTLGGTKNIPSPLGAVAKLAFVVGLFLLIALVVKKLWKGGKVESDSAVLGALGRFARKNLGSRDKIIEIVANHHLGPKKSIAVIKVSGRTLVVGITEQSINLISQISSEEDAMNALVEMDNPPLEEAIKTHETPKSPAPGKIPGTGATVAGPVAFSKLLQTESVKPQAGPGTGAQLAHTKMANTKARDVRVTSYGAGAGGFTGNGTVPSQDAMSAQAALGLSGVRAQIKNKLEGLKQI